eukprot:7536132-Pyramimonas_sp.AAC.1
MGRNYRKRKELEEEDADDAKGTTQTTQAVEPPRSLRCSSTLLGLGDPSFTQFVATHLQRCGGLFVHLDISLTPENSLIPFWFTYAAINCWTPSCCKSSARGTRCVFQHR